MGADKFEYFAIFGVMRSGSNLLESHLNQFEGINSYGELFNPAFVGKPGHEEAFGVSLKQRESTPELLLRAMKREAQPAIAGFRIFNDHDPRVISSCISDPKCAKIILRRNLLDSYVSLKIARQTDQWMLKNPKKRRVAKITFNIGEFRQYTRETERYYAYLRRSLQESGQVAFEVDYADLKSVEVTNGLAHYIGVEEMLPSLDERIHKQNPATLEDKVENFAEMQEALQAEGGIYKVENGEQGERAVGLRFMSACQTRPILFAAIPGGPTIPVRRWMSGVDGEVPTHPDFEERFDAGEVLRTFSSRKQLTKWYKDHPDGLSFTVVRHPLLRAYDVFMTRILPGGEEGFPMIREQLRNNFDLVVPDESVISVGDRAVFENYGYTLEKHRAAFSAFLEFLRLNLSNQTSIRVDGRWAEQAAFVDGFNSAAPVGLVVREDRLIKAAAYIRSVLDIPDLRNAVLRQSVPSHVIPLEEVSTPRIEALARAAYSRDYAVFGFADFVEERELTEA